MCESCSPYLPDSHHVPDDLFAEEDIMPGHKEKCVTALSKSLQHEDQALQGHNKISIIDYGSGDDTVKQLKIIPIAMECPFYQEKIQSTHCALRKCWILLNMSPTTIIRRQALRAHERVNDPDRYRGTPKRTDWKDPSVRQQLDISQYRKEAHYKNGILQQSDDWKRKNASEFELNANYKKLMGRLDLNLGLSAHWLKKGTESLTDEDKKKFQLDLIEDFHTIRYINEDFKNAKGKDNLVWPVGTNLAADAPTFLSGLLKAKASSLPNVSPILNMFCHLSFMVSC